MVQHGLKRRQSRFHSSKVVAKAPVFHNARCVTGVVTLPPGRYAVIPCTYVPTPVRASLVMHAAVCRCSHPPALFYGHRSSTS